MKYLLGGTALAALTALAIAAPVWAQAPAPQYPPGTPSQPPPATYGQQPAPPPYAQQPKPSAPYAEQPAEPPKRYTCYKRHMHHPRYGYGHARGRGPTDNVANQLNRAELSQSYGGGMPPAGYRPAPGYPPRGYMPQGYPPPGYPPEVGPRPSGH
jgi:hypothetical protein